MAKMYCKMMSGRDQTLRTPGLKGRVYSIALDLFSFSELEFCFLCTVEGDQLT